MLNLQLSSAVMAESSSLSGYKAMVCIFLSGGNDSFNMVAPFTASEHNDYVSARGGLADGSGGGLALDRNGNGSRGPQLLPIDIGGGRQLGIHATMPEIRDLYQLGDAAVVANVGSLIEPTTKANYQSVAKPLGLFSHADLIKHWQTAVPQSRQEVTGWGGRMAELLTPSTSLDPRVSMNISIESTNTFQSGNQLVPYVVGINGASEIGGLHGSSRFNPIYEDMTNHLYPSTNDGVLSSLYSSMLERTLAGSRKMNLDAASHFNAAISGEPTTSFPSSNLGARLKMVAKTIAGRAALGHGRQTFFVGIGGWDHHDGLNEKQDAMLADLSQCIRAFYDETVAMGVANDVTTFTASDFGRTLSSNGDGSDHAWGGNHLVIGGGVDGGKVFGEYPESLAPGNNVELGRGRIIPTTSVDEYCAELACWFGVSASDLTDVLPNIGNFWTPGGSAGPLGFLT